MESNVQPSDFHILGSLFEATSDRDEKVREVAYNALKRIAKLHTSDVLSCSINYRRRNPKLNSQELKKLLNLMENICNDYAEQIPFSRVEELIEFSIEESLKCNDQQYASSDILTIIGKNYCNQIAEKLLKHMQHGIVAHSSVIYILGNLALVNVNAFLPLAKTCLDFIASILSFIKTDISRKLYASAVGNIAESIVEYRAVNEESVAKENYSPVIEEIYEVFATSWLQTKDSKLCEAIVYAFSSMLQLFSAQKLWNDTNRITSTLLQQYRRSPALPRYPITLCIGNLLLCTPRASLQPVLDTILHALHVMVWITPDFAQPLTVKNHSEVLRCYDHIGKLFGEKLCEIILRNLRSNSEQDKVVALLVVTHLLGSSDAVIKPRAVELITTLYSLLNETSVKINKGLVKVIVALACKNFLSEKDYVFIEFLVKHVHHAQTSFELEDLQSMCNNTIFLLSSTVPAVQPLCWTVLLQLLLTGAYDEATSIIARSLTLIISKCDMHIIDNADNNPKPESVFVRILALLGSPLESNRGSQLLAFYFHYVPRYLAVNKETWKKEISKLMNYLETSEWDDRKWENMMLGLMESSIIEDSRTWITPVVSEIASQLTLYEVKLEESVTGSVDQNVKIDESGMLYMCLALFSLHVENEQLLNSSIEKIISTIQRHSTKQLKACSRAIGILSKSKLDEILARLENKAQLELSRKSSRFLGLLKDVKHESEMETVRYMISEYFAQIVTEAVPSKLLKKIKYILIWSIAQINACKYPETWDSCIETISRIAIVLNENQDTCEDLSECRNLIMDFILPVIENANTLPHSKVLRTLVTTSKFRPYLQAHEKLSILQKVFIKVFQFISTDDKSFDKKSTSIQSTISELCSLIEEMIESKNTYLLEEIVNFIQPWLGHNKSCHRSVAVLLLLTSIRCFIQQEDVVPEGQVSFIRIGSLFGSVCIRIYEENAEIKRNAKHCAILLSIIVDHNEGRNITKEEFRNILSNADSLNISVFLQTVCHKFPSNQIPSLIESLIDGLLDTEETCVYGASQLLLVLFKEIGNSLNHQALDIFSSLLSKLMKLPTAGDAQNTAIKALLHLGSCHRKMFLSTMLGQTLPLHSSVCKCWQLLSENENFTLEIIDSLLEVIKSNSLYEDTKKKGRDKRNIAAALPLVATSIMKEIFISKSIGNMLKGYVAEIFSTLLVLMASYIGTVSPANTSNKSSLISNKDSYNVVPSKIACDTLSEFLSCVGCTECVETLKICRIELSEILNDSVLDTISALARSLYISQSNEITKVLEVLTQYINSSIESQRITVTVFCAEILNMGSLDEAAVNNIINHLLTALSDTSPTVRQHSLKGLASISELDRNIVSNHYENVLSALLQGLEDDDASIYTGITLEALNGLSKLIPLLTNNIFSITYVSIAIRIKPYFEKEDVNVRSMSIKLFGELASIVGEDDIVSFSEHINSSFICFLLHLAEHDSTVVKVCKSSLKSIASLLKSKNVANMITNHLVDVGNLFYTEFLTQITKFLVKELPELTTHFLMTAVSYSKSIWPEVRAAAVLFIGVMFNETECVPENISTDSISCRLLVLLKDTDATVRTNAAYSLSLMFCK